MALLLKLIVFLPLFSAITNGLCGKKISLSAVKLISSAAIILSAICAYYVFFQAGINKQTTHIILFSWLKSGNLEVNWSLYVDQLTATMFLLVTNVSAVVHIYSLGYMEDDKSLHKFLAYLSLFTFFMLSLVSADNLIQLFFGWEGVGLCSYLLIGYYCHKESANKAAIKAFIVNRVSDLAFILGIALIIIHVGGVEFSKIFTQAQNLAEMKMIAKLPDISMLDVICLLLLVGCMGKSAQIGLHVWLPDAMEGPTPVSALIHAATMVTAGVFLIIRCSFLFEYSPLALSFVTIIGAVTCLFAALIAIAQTDLKKIIAYSTCSQLGYMFFACGVSAYQAAMFHLVTHGFFKALLFLSAGSVIHATHQQDLFKMGNLRKKMPITYANFWLGSLAIIGIYPFAGFYSKDLILESAYIHDGYGYFAFILGIVAAVLTAIYSMKIIMLVFHGESKLSQDEYEKVHESPIIMNGPLFLLLFGTLFSGMFGFYILDIANPYGFFAEAIFNLDKNPHPHLSTLIESLPLLIGLFGMFVGYLIYRGYCYEKIADRFKIFHHILYNKFFIDEIYDYCFVRTTNHLAEKLKYFDKNILDHFGPDGVKALTLIWSRLVCRIQTGYIYNYALFMVLALVIYLTFIVSTNLPIAVF